MASPQPTAETSLRISRTYPAPREEVFRAWTDPKVLERWFAPDPEFVTKVPVLELRPGGGVLSFVPAAPLGALVKARPASSPLRA